MPGCAALCAALAWLAGCAAGPLPRDYRVVAYVAGWSMPAVIPAEKLTHVNFAFAKIDRGGRVGFEQPGLAVALKSLVALKQVNADLRIIVSVGGWGADGFSDAALTDASRNAFAGSVIALIREHRVDGIDLDWEYPGQGVAGIQSRPEDRENFTRLLAALRARLDAASDADGRAGRDRYLLTIASADREYFEHVEMEKLHVHLDWLNVMTYDFFNSLTRTTGHHAGLYAAASAAPAERHADASIRQHLAAGVPREKLVLGVPFYGRGFAGVQPARHGLNQPYERYEGDHSYCELVERFIGRQGFVRHWDGQARAPFLWNDATRTFITYDDPQSIRAKADYVRDHRLGGMMFWELSQDRDGELLDVIAAALRSPRQNKYETATRHQ